MRHGKQRRVASKTARWASAFALAALPGAVHGAESVTARGLLAVEPAVGASLSVDLSQDLLLQIGLRGQWGAILSDSSLPVIVMNIENAEFVADSAVSLRVERRASPSTPPTATEGVGGGGALLILAQFN